MSIENIILIYMVATSVIGMVSFNFVMDYYNKKGNLSYKEISLIIVSSFGWLSLLLGIIFIEHIEKRVRHFFKNNIPK